MTTYVYLAHDADGEVLYIGHTRDVTQRMAGHRATADWPKDVARIDVEEYPTAEEARWVERTYITDLEPLHNIRGNPRFSPEWYEATAS